MMSDLIVDDRGENAAPVSPLPAVASDEALLMALHGCVSLGKEIDVSGSIDGPTILGAALIPERPMPSTGVLPDGTDEPLPRVSSAVPTGRMGRYQILGEIARGGMGVVLLGRDGELNRDLAVKILLEHHRAKPDLRRRFVEEAQIGGQLQHPGIVPIYDLGTFSDDRPFFAMKLVRGRTLAVLLRERTSPKEDLARHLVIFEQISQTIAYAHSKGVVHRDLKPSNVMVGSFGEVQVMDWGLAKVFDPGAADAPSHEPVVSVVRAMASDTDADASVAGVVMGTPAYMSREQANGEVHRIDERTDVFGLGSILCEILTGMPAYTGSRGEMIVKAKKGDLTDAIGRLATCGAEPDLIRLATQCLSFYPADRPRDASAVAKALTAHLASVQDRLRASELARVEAQAKAQAERMRRKFTVALASLILLGGLVGGGSWFSVRLAQEARIAEANRLASDALVLTEAAFAEAKRTDLTNLDAWDRACDAAEKAKNVVIGLTIKPALRRQVERMHTTVLAEADRLRTEVKRIEANRLLVDKLDDARLRGDGVNLIGFDSQAKTAAYAKVFREAGIDLTILPPREAAVLLASRGSTVRISAALDDWAHDEPDPARKDALLEIARTIDPDPFRNQIRKALIARDRATLVALTRDERARMLSATSVVLVADPLAVIGGREEAVEFLSGAQSRYPDDFWINQTLGFHLGQFNPPRRDESVRFLTVAVALRPRSPGAHLGLGVALAGSDKKKEATESFRRAIALKPDYGEAHLNLAVVLIGQGQLAEAIQECQEAIKTKPRDAYAYHNLGYAFLMQDQKQKAIDAFRKVLELDPNSSGAYHLLGYALQGQGKAEEAIAAYVASLKLEPENADTHHNLGFLLTGQDRPEEAIAHLLESKRLKPNNRLVYVNLANTLFYQGKREEALDAYKTAVDLDHDYADAYWGLGECLRSQGRYPRALAAFRRAHELGSEQPGWPYPSAEWIRQCERLIAVGDALPALIKGDAPPRDTADRLLLSVVCRDRQLYAAAVRFSSQALADDPSMADDRTARHRYQAACTAILAGLGRGLDDPAPDGSARAALRSQGRAWLREELAALARFSADGTVPHRATVVATLRDWKYDPRLHAVYNPEALARLPEPERKDWGAFWREVDALSASSGGRK
ncbi:MAG: serine/threonine protein kinase [Planctomycetota bacterium]|nr:serine/threonine protein kinase [Planctomycetota bacterium]